MAPALLVDALNYQLILERINMGITIEDANNERYYINPRNVVYVKRRENFWKILLIGGEVIMTKNDAGAKAIIEKFNGKI